MGHDQVTAFNSELKGIPYTMRIFIKSSIQLAVVFAALSTVIGDTRAYADFHISNVGVNGVIGIDSHITYYDGSDGTLFHKVAIPAGATQMQFRVTGGVITDSSNRLASADGLYANGQTPYNFTGTRFNGTYQGVVIGSTTGIDPALFGVFFNPNFDPLLGAPNSANYRSDSGSNPDNRTLLSYSPLANQPFYIGDGSTGNNAFSTTSDSSIPQGTIQTFNIPIAAKYFLLGIGADVGLNDNQDSAGAVTGFKVHVFDNSPVAVPEPSSLFLMGVGFLSVFGYAVRFRKIVRG